MNRSKATPPKTHNVTFTSASPTIAQTPLHQYKVPNVTPFAETMSYTCHSSAYPTLPSLTQPLNRQSTIQSSVTETQMHDLSKLPSNLTLQEESENSSYGSGSPQLSDRLSTVKLNEDLDFARQERDQLQNSITAL